MGVGDLIHISCKYRTCTNEYCYCLIWIPHIPPSPLMWDQRHALSLYNLHALSLYNLSLQLSFTTEACLSLYNLSLQLSFTTEACLSLYNLSLHLSFTTEACLSLCNLSLQLSFTTKACLSLYNLSLQLSFTTEACQENGSSPAQQLVLTSLLTMSARRETPSSGTWCKMTWP